jgi:hypothetical protein
MAGQDISHWFDPVTQDVTPLPPSPPHVSKVRRCVDARTSLLAYYAPSGRFLHLPPPHPSTSYDNSYRRPWWRNEKARVGRRSMRTRHVRIVNMLTKDEHVLRVCAEEPVGDIRDKYLAYNSHAESYVWKRLGDGGGMVQVDMNKNLEENGVADEGPAFAELGLDEEFYIPSLHLYFKDDLSVA